uniref:Bifunctional methylenetetrahydrofolate dehydrogenase/cyclohydrolase, mitochondrial n=1 Tax=Cacopsylla melanoneura TaxID=428564 RepID=A0A8D8RRF8_9HEMI
MFSRICCLISQKSSLHTSSICNTAQIIDGKFIANTILEELKIEVKEWVALGHRIPTLSAILVGNDLASATYVNNKMKAAAKVGINSNTIRMKESVSELELLECINELNNNPTVDAILVQRWKHLGRMLLCVAARKTLECQLPCYFMLMGQVKPTLWTLRLLFVTGTHRVTNLPDTRAVRIL